MNLLLLGGNFRTAPIKLRERLAIDQERLNEVLAAWTNQFEIEAIALSTCNRFELYLASTVGPMPAREAAVEFLCALQAIAAEDLTPHLYQAEGVDAIHHLFRVAASLDSLVIGEAQIAGQVKAAYEAAQQCGTVGPVFHSLFQHARHVAGRVRSETGLCDGHASISTVALDYVREVFDSLEDKVVLLIGMGKMGTLALRQLRRLHPAHVLICNREPERAIEAAKECGGERIAWEKLDDALARADLVISATGSREPVVNLPRYERIISRRSKAGCVLILDIAVPRDFDPRIHDGDRTFLFNIDDLARSRDRAIQQRLQHVEAAERIVEQEVRRFCGGVARRRHAAVIARLTQDLETKRRAIVRQLLTRLNGRLTDADRLYIEGAFRLLQNQFLHGPISTLAEDGGDGTGHTLLEALRKLFRLQD